MARFLTLLLLAPALAAAEGKQRILVLDLRPAGVDQAAARQVTEALAGLVGRRSGVEVLTQADVKTMLSVERDRQLMGCADEGACAAEIGSALAASFVLSGSLGKVGDALVLTLRLHDPQKSATVGSASEPMDDLGPAALEAAYARAEPKLFGQGSERAAPRFTLLGKPEEKVSLAVIDLAAQGVAPETAGNVTQVVAVELKRAPNFTVISKDEIAALMSFEQQKQLLGCEESSCLAEIGGALGVGYIVTGSVGKVGESLMVTLKLVEIRAARVLNRVAEGYQGKESDLIRAARAATAALVGAERTGSGVLQIVCSVDEADATVDGLPSGKTPLPPLSLPVGKHSVRLDAEWHASQVLDTYVEAEDTTTLRVELAEIPKPWYRRWYTWAGAAAVLLGGAATTYVLTQGPETGTLDLTFQKGAR